MFRISFAPTLARARSTLVSNVLGTNKTSTHQQQKTAHPNVGSSRSNNTELSALEAAISTLRLCIDDGTLERRITVPEQVITLLSSSKDRNAIETAIPAPWSDFLPLIPRNIRCDPLTTFLISKYGVPVELLKQHQYQFTVVSFLSSLSTINNVDNVMPALEHYLELREKTFADLSNEGEASKLRLAEERGLHDALSSLLGVALQSNSVETALKLIDALPSDVAQMPSKVESGQLHEALLVEVLLSCRDMKLRDEIIETRFLPSFEKSSSSASDDSACSPQLHLALLVLSGHERNFPRLLEAWDMLRTNHNIQTITLSMFRAALTSCAAIRSTSFGTHYAGSEIVKVKDTTDFIMEVHEYALSYAELDKDVAAGVVLDALVALCVLPALYWDRSSSDAVHTLLMAHGNNMYVMQCCGKEGLERVRGLLAETGEAELVRLVQSVIVRWW
eukprot:PhM_4_TR8776/c0_g1_i1/m.88962